MWGVDCGEEVAANPGLESGRKWGGLRGRDSQESGLLPCSTQPPAPNRSVAAGSLGMSVCARHLRPLKAWCVRRRWPRLPGEGGLVPRGVLAGTLAAEVRSM